MENTMATISYKNRYSSDYRFTVESLDNPAIEQLRTMLKNSNYYANRYNKFQRSRGNMTSRISTYGIRIRPRGPRGNDYYDTPMKNATHYDIYTREYYARDKN